MPCSTFLFAAAIITNLAQLADCVVPGSRYAISGIVTYAESRVSGIVAVEDGAGDAVTIANETLNPFCDVKAGDVIRASGRTAIGSNGTIRRNCSAIDVTGRNAPPPPIATSVKDLADGRMDNRFVRIKAMLRDVFLDEIDSGFVYLVLQDGADTVICFRRRDEDTVKRLQAMIGSRLEVTGVCSLLCGGSRIRLGRALIVSNNDAFKVITSPPKDDFDIPDAGELGKLDPSRIAQHGRCRTVGTVIATWGRNKLLVKDNWSRLTEVELAEDVLPPCGTMVEVAGLPASNFFRINLLRAKWRKSLGPPMPFDTPEDIPTKSLFSDKKNQFRYNPSFFGRTIRIRGTVKAMMSGEYNNKRFFLESDSFMIPVDTTPAPTAIDRVKIGYGIEIAGVCIMEGSNWSPYSAFPQIHGMTLVVRSADDIRIVSSPSWWTPKRLLIVLGIVLSILGGIVFWNILLHKAVRVREKDLKKEIFAHVNSDMKMRERNNLSIELHDSLSQGLTGVSLEIDSARRMADNPAEMDRHLDLAAKTLKACRNELRTCIYDLRSNALGDKDMSESIRRTLAPFIDSTSLTIRFNVPRDRMSDNVAHNILRIVSELVVNAVRHGHASSVKVAGGIEGDVIRFSVRDNGCGFDPDKCPGAGQGHFGLQGIRERLKRLNGNIVFESAADTGTKAVVTVALPMNDDLEEK